MEIIEFGEITPVDVRKIWPNEATDFTPWLAKNRNKGRSSHFHILLAKLV